ncbi:hypothetical protein BS47DRAFT_1389550 [Hydnum rufescens UP504]|uniref:Uncharacterized protein n=1 Tax=Hydnum rufescens UP504 TaxID=1448309 RepID=A0A9P6E0H9_9AGAM|nr:hypothetical protein BS47DRAFT_1389550 [Hydnum rufescens UP504]
MPPPQPGLFEYTEPYHISVGVPNPRRQQHQQQQPQQQHQHQHTHQHTHTHTHQHPLPSHHSSQHATSSHQHQHQHDRVKVIRSSGAPGGAGSGTTTAAAGPSNGVILGASKSSGSVEPELRQARDGGKRKREIMERVIKYSRDMSDRRDEIYSSSLTALTSLARRLHQNPADTAAYAARLYPLALERAALLDAIELEEQHALDSAQTIWKAEVNQIDDEFKKGKARLRERIMEGLEERRRRAREEKEGEAIVPVESSLEVAAGALNRPTNGRLAPFTLSAPIPYGLSPDDLASPFPLSLTSIQPSHSSGGGGGGPGRKPRLNRTGGKEGGVLTLGKAIAGLTPSKESDIDHDLGEIRRGVKRRRAAVKAQGGVV